VHIEPVLYDHVQAMVAIALAEQQPVEVVRLAEWLPQQSEQIGELLANLTAAGLLCPEQEETIGTTGAYRLARPPKEIGLNEIARAASYGAVGGPTHPTTAAWATRVLSTEFYRHVQRALAQFTLADFVSARAEGGGYSAPGTSASNSPVADSEMTTQAPPSLERLGITVADLWDRVHAGEIPIVLDVRAYPSSQLPAPPWARWIALEQLSEHVGDWPRSCRIVTVCQLGMRSLIGASYLRLLGFNRAHPLIGGLEAWHRSESNRSA
jgi:rhodanese-related sulfurtransferase/DNA-binding IscR family transcriptional regulator